MHPYLSCSAFEHINYLKIIPSARKMNDFINYVDLHKRKAALLFDGSRKKFSKIFYSGKFEKWRPSTSALYFPLYPSPFPTFGGRSFGGSGTSDTAAVIWDRIIDFSPPPPLYFSDIEVVPHLPFPSLLF